MMVDDGDDDNGGDNGEADDAVWFDGGNVGG